MKSLFNLV